VEGHLQVEEEGLVVLEAVGELHFPAAEAERTGLGVVEAEGSEAVR
jgi:hypothetical protein